MTVVHTLKFFVAGSKSTPVSKKFMVINEDKKPQITG